MPPSDPPRAHVQADSPAAGAVDAPRPRLFDALAAQRRTAVAAAIEDAALGLFAARRMDDVTMDEIAAAAGVAVRTVYRYFPTKDQILLAVPLRGGEAMSAAIRSRPTSEAPFEALRNAIEAMAPTVDNAELERWFTALGRNEPNGRLTRMAFLVSTEALTEALAERAGLTPQDLWPAMAGTMAANALLVGQHQWSMHGGDLATHQLAALQIAGDGLAAFDPGRTGRNLLRTAAPGSDAASAPAYRSQLSSRRRDARTDRMTSRAGRTLRRCRDQAPSAASAAARTCASAKPSM